MYKFTTQKTMRAAFWRENPQASRKMIGHYSGTGKMYETDTRVLWSDWIDVQCRAGRISSELAQRATLQPAKTKTVWRIFGRYDGRTFEEVSECDTRTEAFRELAEYRIAHPGHSHIIRRGRAAA